MISRIARESTSFRLNYSSIIIIWELSLLIWPIVSTVKNPLKEVLNKITKVKEGCGYASTKSRVMISNDRFCYHCSMNEIFL